MLTENTIHYAYQFHPTIYQSEKINLSNSHHSAFRNRLLFKL